MSPALRRLLPAGLALAAFWAAGAAPANAAPLELEGTWYVLIHYRDTATANPDADRWRDLVWVFTEQGDRLRWTEYPMVVFDDTTGRFEAYKGNPRSRVLAAWEPNAAQREAIDDGPPVSKRGSKTKSLRRDGDAGWRSSARRTQGSAAGSALVIGYHEELAIQGLDGLPVFERRDVFGNATRSSAEGFVRYEVTERGDGGTLLRGRYARDESQRGRFRMWRTQPVRKPTSKRLTLAEQQAKFLDELMKRAQEGDEEARQLLLELMREGRAEQMGDDRGPSGD